jgi:hypothetical protein
MQTIRIPSRRRAPMALKYMLQLCGQRLNFVRLWRLQGLLDVCSDSNSDCSLCEYSEQCAAMYDGLIDRLMWYSERVHDDTEYS